MKKAQEGIVFSSTAVKSGLNGKLNGKVLILNHDYQPLSICNARKAVILLFLGKAELIEAKDGQMIRSVSMNMPYPSIVRLSLYIRVRMKKVILSRKNIIRRDMNTCQYCGNKGVPLTVDHVIPRARGGMDSWENLVTACVKCNNKKGDRTPEEANIKLIRQPRRPNHVTFIRHFAGRVDERWKPYLYM